MGHYPILGGSRIVRHDHQQGIGPCLLDHLHHAYRVRRVVGTRSRNDWHIDSILDGPDQIDLFLHVGDGRLACCAVDQDAVGPIGHQGAGQVGGCPVIHGSVFIHRRDHGGDHPAKWAPVSVISSRYLQKGTLLRISEQVAVQAHGQPGNATGSAYGQEDSRHE